MIVDWINDWLTDSLADSFTDSWTLWPTHWLTGWLLGWLTEQATVTPCFGCLWVDLVTVQETLQGSQRRVLSEQQCYEHGGQVPFITSRCVLQLIHQFEDHMCRAEQEMGNESNALGTSHLSSRMGCEHHFHHQRRQICCIQGCIKRTWRTGSPF